jgi:hypothetical protein
MPFVDPYEARYPYGILDKIENQPCLTLMIEHLQRGNVGRGETSRIKKEI